MTQPTVAAPGARVRFAFDTLGWREFQDLCAAVLAEVLGQTFEIFSPGGDGGRDGAFRGRWMSPDSGEVEGTFTAQCKHTSLPNKHLDISDLSEELPKVEALAVQGLADIYILITNCYVSGVTAARITALFEKAGVKRPMIFGAEWLATKIYESPRLRALVPRIYGLGDLSQILDERAYEQASVILDSLRYNLKTFVPTAAYRRALDALNSYGLVVLLGEPACGKTTLASMLCLHAADAWGARMIRLASPAEFAAHWNPNEPSQLFWVDDAFGVTQYQDDRLREWNQALPTVRAALERGVRIILTSRDYIYFRARPLLKTSALPILHDGEVVIQVRELTENERQRILYNHIRLGDQTTDFKSEVKPWLLEVASLPQFLPETARRLGNRFFTRDVGRPTREWIVGFVERPEAFLSEVVAELADDEKAGLAAVYAARGQLASPIDEASQIDFVTQAFDCSVGRLKRALESLDGSLVRLVTQEGSRRWQFSHPTVGDAFGQFLAAHAELLGIYVANAPLDQLLSEITAGDVGLEGTRVVLQKELFPELATRLVESLSRGNLFDEIVSFLSYRADGAFLVLLSGKIRGLQEALLPRVSYLSMWDGPRILSKLKDLGILDEEVRRRLVELSRKLSVETPDADFLTSPYLRGLLSDDEVSSIMDHVSESLDVDEVISNWRFNYSKGDDTPEGYFAPLREAFEAYKKYYKVAREQERSGRMRAAVFEVDRVVLNLTEEEPDPQDWADEDFDRTGQGGVETLGERDPFDDVDQ